MEDVKNLIKENEIDCHLVNGVMSTACFEKDIDEMLINFMLHIEFLKIILEEHMGFFCFHILKMFLSRKMN